MVKQRCRRCNFVGFVVHQHTEIAQMPVSIADDCIKNEHIFQCIHKRLSQLHIIFPDRLHAAFRHKLSDGQIGILLAGEQLALGTERLFQVFGQGIADRIHAHSLCHLISIKFRVRFKPQIAEP